MLPFWFKKQTDHERFLVTCDGASGHDYHNCRQIAKEKLRENNEQIYIPKQYITGVP